MNRPTLAALVAAVAALSLGATAVAAESPTTPVGAALPPDLVVLPLVDLDLQHRGSRTLLRLGNRVGNLGPGPLELRPQRADCDGDGDASNDRRGYQRIYRDGNGDGQFDARRDRGFSRRPAACSSFHRRHDHWHYADFARYELRRASDNAVVRSSAKVSFCMIDMFQVEDAVPGQARASSFTSCEADLMQGLSVGWADEYGSYLPGQHIDVSGLPRANYCLVSTVDPSGSIEERDETNNVATMAVTLRPTRVIARPERTCLP